MAEVSNDNHTEGSSRSVWRRALGVEGDSQSDAIKEFAEKFWYCVYVWWRRAGLDPITSTTAATAAFNIWAHEKLPHVDDLGVDRMREWTAAQLPELAKQGVKLKDEPLIEIDQKFAEKRYAEEPDGDPASIFERRWALTVIEITTVTLQNEYTERGEDVLYQELHAFSGFDQPDDDRYTAAAERLGKSTGAIRAGVYELRVRQREIMLDVVADTVLTSEDAESEIMALMIACDAPGADAATAPLPTVIRDVKPDEVLVRAMNSVRMTQSSSGEWQPPTIEEMIRLFPQYEVVSLVGRGGMGAVYKARQIELDRTVAIKLLPLEVSVDSNFADRFRREARAMAKLQHPNIILVYEFGTTSEGHLFIVMEFVDGADLHQMIHGPGVNPPQALNIIIGVCDALAYAHEKGVVHRDIKPANVMVSVGGEVKVADFGLARLLDPGTEQMGYTMTGTVMGTPDYMAPEQMSGMDVDHRADIYSLGVMLYEMLCGEVPRGIFEPPSGRCSGVDTSIDKVVARAMQQQPDSRYQTTREMKTDVAAASEANTPVAKGIPRKPARVKKPRVKKPRQRKPISFKKLNQYRNVIASSAAVLALAFGIWVWAPWAGSAPPAGPSFLTGPVDLISLIDPREDCTTTEASSEWANQWEKGDGVLSTSGDGTTVMIKAPLAVHSRYFQVDMDFNADFSKQPKQVYLFIPGSIEGEARSGPIRFTEGGGIRMGDIKSHKDFYLGWSSEPAQAGRVAVRWDMRNKEIAKLEILNDGKVFHSWEGDPALVLYEDSKHPDLLRLACFGQKVVYREWKLTLFEGEAKTLREPHRTYRPSAEAPAENVSAKTPVQKVSETKVPSNSPPVETCAVFQGHRYLFVPSKLPWPEAKLKAESMGGHLATITSKAEDEWAMRLIQTNLEEFNALCWIGASEKSEGAGWKWHNGEPFDYTGWGPTEPNWNKGVNQHGDYPFYVGYFQKGGDEGVGWNDVSLTNRAWGKQIVGFLVEWDSDPDPAKATNSDPYVNTLGMKFVPVPITGDPSGGNKILFSIWETRRQDYQWFTKETKTNWPSVDWKMDRFSETPQHPAVRVNWHNAKKFCRWLTEKERKAGAIPRDARYRLPLDHEWSCAAGIGELEDPVASPLSKSAKINIFAWGDQWPPPSGFGNYFGQEAIGFSEGYPIKNYRDAFAKTSPVGSFKANKLGVFDLSGNLCEWSQEANNRADGEAILRGGSWFRKNEDTQEYNLSKRHTYHQNSTFHVTGFRAVLELPPLIIN